MTTLIIYETKQCETPKDSLFQWNTLSAVHSIVEQLKATQLLERTRIKYLEASQLTHILDEDELKDCTDIHLVDVKILFSPDSMQELKKAYGINFHLYGCKLETIQLKEKLGDDFFSTELTDTSRATCLKVWQNFKRDLRPSPLLRHINDDWAGVPMEELFGETLHRVLREWSLPYGNNIFGILSWIDEIAKYEEKDFSKYIFSLNE